MGEVNLSVVLANYNHARYLPTQLDAIFASSHTPDEVIVLDDCSTDNSVDILRSYARTYPKLRVLQNERNMGAIPSYNKVASAAQGKYYCAIAADDQIMPRFFEKAMELLEHHPEAGFCSARPLCMDESGHNIRRAPVLFPEEPCYLTPQQLTRVFPRGLWVSGPSCILRMDLAKRFGLYDPALAWVADWFLNHAVISVSGACFHPVDGSAQRLMPDSYATAGNRNYRAKAEVLWAMSQKLRAREYREFREFFVKAELYTQVGRFGKYIADAITAPENASDFGDQLESLAWKMACYEKAQILLKPLLDPYRELKRIARGDPKPEDPRAWERVQRDLAMSSSVSSHE